MRSSEIGSVVSGQIEVTPSGARLDLRGGFPGRFEPTVIVNRRMLLPVRKPRGRSIR